MSEINRRGTSVWEFFDKIDAVKKEAECKLCHNVYKYKGTSHNLKLHLKFKHEDVFMSLPESVRTDNRSNSNGVWHYFRPVDGDDKVATCLACQKVCSYRTTTANLKTHLRRLHHEMYEQMLGGDETEYYLEVDEDDHRASGSHDEEAEESSTVWGYYEREGPRARCVVCRAVVSRNELKSHLRAKHPKLVSEVDLGSDDEASDTQEDLYTEIVYLEDEQNARKQKSTPKPKPKPKSYTERSEPRKRLPSSSSDEAPLRRRKTKTDDEPANIEEIEQFGKYVTCLLKKIPPAACMELQAEIINLIMKKQLELRRNEMSVLAGNIMAETVNDRTDGFESTPSASNFISNGSNVIENKE